MADYSTYPSIEEMCGAGFKFDEAKTVLEYARSDGWSATRLWAYVLKHVKKTLPKLDEDALSAHLKLVSGDDHLASIE